MDVIPAKTFHQLKLSVFFVIATLLMATSLATTIAYRANAAPVVGFNPENIIDDFVFTNVNTMSPSNIQSFLNSKVPTCDTYGTQPSEFGGGTRRQWAEARGYSPPYTCLKDYSENGKSAAQIIYNAAQEFQINPQVLIVLLQKEQALVTDTWPLPSQYRTATGYGCPDTAACATEYYGFTNQLRWAARMFRAIINDSPTWYTPYELGQNFIRWNPSASCGGSTINIANRSTQALYNYTPYRPNQAALNAGYGTGDSCSSYGNRNFYLYFTDWFGSVRANDTTQPHPDGTVVSFDGAAYLIENGALRHIAGGAVFESHDFRWEDIKPATTGDRQLPKTTALDYIRPGVFYRTPNSGVYRTVNLGGNNWAKELISYTSFTNLNFNWSKVMVIPDSSAPAQTVESPYTQNRHPDGTLINDNSSVYWIENGTKRYVSATVFQSQKWSWNNIEPATAEDKALPKGSDMIHREGAIINSNGNLYVIKVNNPNDMTAHPIGPWECYSNRFKYGATDAIIVPGNQLPRIGSLITC